MVERQLDATPKKVTDHQERMGDDMNRWSCERSLFSVVLKMTRRESRAVQTDTATVDAQLTEQRRLGEETK